MSNYLGSENQPRPRISYDRLSPEDQFIVDQGREKAGMIEERLNAIQQEIYSLAREAEAMPAELEDIWAKINPLNSQIEQITVQIEDIEAYRYRIEAYIGDLPRISQDILAEVIARESGHPHYASLRHGAYILIQSDTPNWTKVCSKIAQTDTMPEHPDHSDGRACAYKISTLAEICRQTKADTFPEKEQQLAQLNRELRIFTDERDMLMARQARLVNRRKVMPGEIQRLQDQINQLETIRANLANETLRQVAPRPESGSRLRELESGRGMGMIEAASQQQSPNAMGPQAVKAVFTPADGPLLSPGSGSREEVVTTTTSLRSGGSKNRGGGRVRMSERG